MFYPTLIAAFFGWTGGCHDNRRWRRSGRNHNWRWWGWWWRDNDWSDRPRWRWWWWRCANYWYKGLRNWCLNLSAETIDQTNRCHVDVATVSDGVTDAIALYFSSHSKCFRNSVLQTKAHFNVGVVAIRSYVVQRKGAGACKAASALRIGGTNPAKDGELVAQRQHSHQIKVKAPDAGVTGKRAKWESIKCASWGGIKTVIKLAQIKITAFDCEITVELVATKELVTVAAVVFSPGIDLEALTGQNAIGGIVVELCPGGSQIGTNVRTGG